MIKKLFDKYLLLPDTEFNILTAACHLFWWHAAIINRL